jgi:Trp operon repressor
MSLSETRSLLEKMRLIKELLEEANSECEPEDYYDCLIHNINRDVQSVIRELAEDEARFKQKAAKS